MSRRMNRVPVPRYSPACSTDISGSTVVWPSLLRCTAPRVMKPSLVARLLLLCRADTRARGTAVGGVRSAGPASWQYRPGTPMVGVEDLDQCGVELLQIAVVDPPII